MMTNLTKKSNMLKNYSTNSQFPIKLPSFSGNIKLCMSCEALAKPLSFDKFFRFKLDIVIKLI